MLDYCEVKHLQKAEFYSTLESLRTTSRELRSSEHPKERCVSASSSSRKSKQRDVKGKKLKKKPPAAAAPPPAPPSAPVLCSSLSVPDLPANPECTFSSSCLTEEYDKCLRDLTRIKSFKNDFAIEVADFKRSLKDFELEFKRKLERPKSTSSSTTTTATQANSNTRCLAAAVQPKFPAMHTAERAKCRRQMLRRSLSVNDLGGWATPAADAAAVKPSVSTCMSNYFPPKDVIVPKLHIESPSVSSKRSSNSSVVSGSSRLRRRRARRTAKVKSETEAQEKQPTLLSIFELEQLPKRATSSVSPQHPVARPNLAATLRAEVSRKKVKELKNNCTYHDPRPQYDWEVRKTPAWKSLSLK